MASRIHLGNLPRDTTKIKLETLFSDYHADVENLWIARNPPGFGFIYLRSRADEFINHFNGYNLEGRPMKVELATGKERRPEPPREIARGGERDKRRSSRDRRNSRDGSRDRKRRDDSRDRKRRDSRRSRSRDRKRRDDSRDRKRDDSRDRKRRRSPSSSSSSSSSSSRSH